MLVVRTPLRIGLFVLCFTFVLSQIIAKEPIPPERMEKAEKTFQQLYGTEFDAKKIKNEQTKISYAKKLGETANQTQTNDPILASVIRERAVSLVSGYSSGNPTAIDLLEANLPITRSPVEDLKKLTELREKMLRQDSTFFPARALELVYTLQEKAAAEAAEWNLSQAKKTLTQAKGLTKDSIRNNKELLAELDAQLEVIRLREKLRDKIQEAKNQLRQSPDNQEAILMAGIGKFLLDPDPQEALSLLRKCQEPTIKKFSDAMKQINRRIRGDALLEVADLPALKEYRPLILDKVLEFYRYWLKIATNKTEQARIELLIPKIREEIGAAENSLLGGTAKALFAKVQSTVKAGKMTKIKEAGAAGSIEFLEISSNGILIGMEFHVVNQGTDVLGGYRPIYLTPNGKETAKKVVGTTVAKPIKVEAKPGYAVGNILLAGSLPNFGMRLVFMEIVPEGLNPSKQYTSDWIGESGNTGQAIMDTVGKPIVGIYGKRDNLYVHRGSFGIYVVDTSRPDFRNQVIIPETKK